MDRKGRIQSERYDRNSCTAVFVIFVNFLIGLFMPALEIGQILYIRSLDRLKLQNDQFMLFGEFLPGVWLGLLFLFSGVAGIVARLTKMNPTRRHIRFTVFAALCVVNAVASLMMIGWVAYSIDRMRWDYPQECKGFPYAGTYDHICDYEGPGFYNIIGFLVPMMVLYSVQAATSFIGAVYGFRKVCNCKYDEFSSTS